MTHDNAEQLLPCPFCGETAKLWPDLKVACTNPGCGCWRSIHQQNAVPFYIKDWNTRAQPTPASAMDGGILKALKYLMEYVEELEKAGFGSCEENPAYQQAMGEITEAAIQPVMDQEIKRPKLGDWKKSRDTLQGSAYDQLVPETLQPVADFTDKYNSSDKPWCCWINQETGEECKNPARWDIRWPPFGYEDNTQSCDDHIFNLRGEGRNEITKIPEPVAAPDMVMVPRILETNDAMWQAGRASLARNDKASYGVQISLAWQEMLAAVGKV